MYLRTAPAVWFEELTSWCRDGVDVDIVSLEGGDVVKCLEFSVNKTS